MSYYYRKKYRRSYYRSTGYSYQTERRPRKSFDVTGYIKNEFFTADDITFSRIANLYKQLYGYGAYKYMMDTYPSWKSGRVGLSGQTMHRILECVPKFLTDQKRFYILKCEIIDYIDTLQSKQQNKNVPLARLNTLFEIYAHEINTFNAVNLSWFVGKGIFTESEMHQFLSVCKYALVEKLKLSYRQTIGDILLIQKKLSVLKTGVFSCSYHIDFLQSSIDLSQLNKTSISTIALNSQKVYLEGALKEFAEKYIVEELLKMDFAEREGQVNRFVKSADLDILIDQYHILIEQQQEASLKSQFKGEGGVLYLSMEAKAYANIKKLLFTSAAKLTLLVAIIFAAITLIIGFRLFQISVLIFWGTLIAGCFLVNAINAEYKTFKKLKLDLKLYGK